MTAHCESCHCSYAHSREKCWSEDCDFCSLPPRKHGYNEEAYYARLKKEHEENEPYKKMRDGEK